MQSYLKPPSSQQSLNELMICYCPISINLEQKGLWKKSSLTSFIFSFTQPQRLIIWSPETLYGINSIRYQWCSSLKADDSYILVFLPREQKISTALLKMQRCYCADICVSRPPLSDWDSPSVSDSPSLWDENVTSVDSCRRRSQLSAPRDAPVIPHDISV